MNDPRSSPARGHLLRDLPRTEPDEAFETLLERSGVRVERITSGGQASPEGEWYDQEHAEWVVLVRGSALLEIERSDGSIERLELEPGSWIDLPARVRHRVARTASEEPTVWLAVHWPAAST